MFITNRGIKDDDNTDLIVPDYLKKNKIPYDEIITKSNDKYKYLGDCEYFIDDDIKNCEEAVANTNVKVIMMATPKTKNYENSKIFKANSWKQIYDYIVSNKEKTK